jgi:hypothetical protein
MFLSCYDITQFFLLVSMSHCCFFLFLRCVAAVIAFFLFLFEQEKSNNISSQNPTSDTMAGCTLRESKAT